MSVDDPRAVDLELRFMKLERFVEELSDVVAAQGQTIEALVVETKRLRGLLAAASATGTEREGRGGEENDYEKPPHY